MFFSDIIVASIGFVLVIFFVAEDVKVLKKHSYYNNTIQEIVLYEVNLGDIELEAFKDLSVYLLQISENPLERLRNGVFVNVSTHEMLLFGNDIKTIEPGTFQDLRPLEKGGIRMLSLSFNKLGVIQNGIFTNTKFRQLFLVANDIKYIESGSFDGMVNLVELNLEDNLLESVEVGIFQNLATPASWVDLSLAGNVIEFVDVYAFENTTLHDLDLRDNQLGVHLLCHNYFKRTSASNETGSWEFSCQHGELECYGNKVHSCAVGLYPVSQSTNFIICSMNSSDASLDANNEACATSTNISWTVIQECLSSDQGDEFLAANGRRTDKLIPNVVNSIPTVVLNDVFSAELRRISIAYFQDTLVFILEQVQCGFCQFSGSNLVSGSGKFVVGVTLLLALYQKLFALI
ncbi:uncharacterized protein LOC108909945 isoform X1 [Anoplophora glabripennis]|uniref:uncharacterized protein LOC108909945 isoform X1 n=1 Tax=Anoplophora glabripennis TaxID=217634 RepID=UPI0008746B93|nr:uncharacterized protein LOC108909945 isoform X1 [Anoplophora glabripennis]